VLLPAGAYAVGRTLEELDLESIGVLVMGVHRGEAASLENVSPDLALQSGDRLIVKGTEAHVQLAERRLLMG
jgi:CPA2 family monovalent cation:H+ antiporter-2